MKLRALGYLAGACILHVTAFSLVARLHAVEPAPAELAAASTPLDVEIQSDFERVPEPAAVDVASPLHANAPMGAKVAPRAASPDRAPSAVEPTGPTASSMPGPVAPADSSSWSFSATRPGGGGVAVGDLLGNSGIVVGPDGSGAAPIAEAPPARGVSRTGGLVEGLDQADLANGHGRGGAVLASVEAAARSSDAPTIGRVLFDVTVDRENVVTVSVVNASEDFAGWSNLAGAIATGLRNKRTRIPPGARALRVRVQIDAAVKYPDGRDVRSTGTFVDPKSLTVGVQGKVCSIGLNPLGIGGGCSPENIGSVAARVVQGRVVSESRVD